MTQNPVLTSNGRYLYADWPSGRRIGIPLHGPENELREGLQALAEAVADVAPLAERLNEITMEGTCRTGGNVEHSVGWFALVEDVDDQDYILRIDNNGNKSVEGPFDHVAIGGEEDGYYSPAERRFLELEAEYGPDPEDEDFTDEWTAVAADLENVGFGYDNPDCKPT